MLAASALAPAGEEAAPAAPAAAPTAAPPLALPNLQDLHLPVPRTVKAANAALGMGRQRLALVVGVGTLGSRRVLDSVARDTRALAQTLRASGFVVMVREDIGAAELRTSLAEFHDRLKPDGVGFVYVTGLATQVDGVNLLLPRDLGAVDELAPAELARSLKAGGVALDAFVDALGGGTGAPRLLVVDAAYALPALARLPAPGLAEPRLPPGMMALFGHGLGSLAPLPAVAALPTPEPSDNAALAATPFAHTLVESLAQHRITGPDALRMTRRRIFDDSHGRENPWLGGDTDHDEEIAEPGLVDSLIPQTPEEVARAAARPLLRALNPPAAGEQSVADVLNQNPPSARAGGGPQVGPDTADGARAQRLSAQGGAEGGSAAPSGPAASLGNTASTVANVVGTAAGVVGTVAPVAAGAVSALGSAAGNAAAAVVPTGSTPLVGASMRRAAVVSPGAATRLADTAAAATAAAPT
ncbi:MAG: hypothetical protein KGN16_26435, partial [Burkholderiales bacterium]|nr:hypothetical protein [Burkholderiales bacterium]